MQRRWVRVAIGARDGDIGNEEVPAWPETPGRCPGWSGRRKGCRWRSGGCRSARRSPPGAARAPARPAPSPAAPRRSIATAPDPGRPRQGTPQASSDLAWSERNSSCQPTTGAGAETTGSRRSSDRQQVSCAFPPRSQQHQPAKLLPAEPDHWPQHPGFYPPRVASRGAMRHLWTADAIETVGGALREPDAFIACSRPHRNAVAVPAPIVVFEVVSPGRGHRRRDAEKVDEYELVPSIPPLCCR